MSRKQGRTSKTGRTTKCTPETQRAVVLAIHQGAGREAAASAAKIGTATFREWMARGSAGEEPFAAFAAAVEGAERDLIARAAKVMTDLLGPKTSESVRFAAAKFVLERRAPSMWGSRAAVRVEGADGGPVEVKHSGQVTTPLFTDEQIASMSASQLEAVLKVELEARRARGT